MSLRKINGLVRTGELSFHKEKIGGELHGFVYRSKKGRTHIFIDDLLSPETARTTMLHECGHVILHEKAGAYLLGYDEDREQEADEFAIKYQKQI